jgi:ubiquinone biosynthesis protein UbiJ
MGIAGDIRERIAEVRRSESGDAEASEKIQAAITLLAEHVEDLEWRLAQLERKMLEIDRVRSPEGRGRRIDGR